MIWRPHSIASLVAAIAIAALATTASALPVALQLDRAGLASGELWRLWTGHLVHGSAHHLVYDAGAAALLFVALNRPLVFTLRLLWMAPALSLALLAVLPDLDYYYGLSGLLHGWAVAGALELWRGGRGPEARVAAVLCVGTLIKSAWETWSGTSPFSGGLDMGGPVIHAAHLVGAVLGMAVGSSASGPRTQGFGVDEPPWPTSDDQRNQANCRVPATAATLRHTERENPSRRGTPAALPTPSP